MSGVEPGTGRLEDRRLTNWAKILPIDSRVTQKSWEFIQNFYIQPKINP